MNFNRMTIRVEENECKVFKLKPKHYHAGSVSGGGYRKTSWAVSPIAKPMFKGSYSDCQKFINDKGAEFMSEHGLPC